MTRMVLLEWTSRKADCSFLIVLQMLPTAMERRQRAAMKMDLEVTSSRKMNPPPKSSEATVKFLLMLDRCRLTGPCTLHMSWRTCRKAVFCSLTKL